MKKKLVKEISILGDMMGVDPKNTNQDVHIVLEDGSRYTVIVGTPQNLLTLLDNKKKNFLPWGIPFIIVREVTDEVLWEMVQEYLQDDAFALKYHTFIPSSEMLNELEQQEIVRRKEVREIVDRSLNELKQQELEKNKFKE
jgi:hypothetical protein